MRILLIALCTLHFGCEPGYLIAVNNTSNEDYFIETRPAIETAYGKSSHLDTLRQFRIALTDSTAKYRLPAGRELMIWSNLGKPTLRGLPYDTLVIFSGQDTLQYNRELLLQNLTRRSKREYVLIWTRHRNDENKPTR